MLGDASRSGSRTLGLGVVMRTVRSPVAATEATTLGENARAGASAASTWFSALATAAASRASPLWNFTPSRTVKSHSVGDTCSQPVASAGTTAPSKSTRASPSRHPTRVRTNGSSDSIAQPAVGGNDSAMTSFPPAANAEPADTARAIAKAIARVIARVITPARAPRAMRGDVWFITASVGISLVSIVFVGSLWSALTGHPHEPPSL